MGYAGRNNIYEATIRRMVTQALDLQEQQFRDTHREDTDEQLLAYVCQWAALLGHTPWPREIVGGEFVEQRFGSWKAVVSKAKLPCPSIPDNPSHFARFREERARQALVYRQRKAEKKQRARQRQAQQNKKKQPV